MIRNIFDGLFDLLERNLDIRGLRQRLIASNIANEETPNYKALDIRFKGELDRARERLQLVTTQKGHVRGSRRTEGVEIVTVGTPSGLDGNSVSLEREMVKLAENTVMYNATARILSLRFQMLKEAIREGR